MGKWITIKIPVEISDQVDKYIKNQGKDFLYSSKTQFMANAIRSQINYDKSTDIIRVDKLIGKEVNEWIVSDDAHAKGYHELSQFCGEAVRKLLAEKKSLRFTKITEVDELKKITMIDNDIPISKDPRVTVQTPLSSKKKWYCLLSKKSECVHTNAALNWEGGKCINKVAEDLERDGIIPLD